MSWFRVDDKFHAHEKVKRLPRAVRAEAIGTWTLCGTWSADFERDGFVPGHMVDELGGTAAGAEALIAAGLWRKRRDGFVFVNWAEFQPTRADNERKREQTRTRVRAHRERAKAETTGDGTQDVTRYDDDVRTPRPVPSRPDPTNDDMDLSEGTSRAPQPVAGQTGENSVESGEGDYAAAVDRAAAAVLELTGRTVHRLEASAIVDHYLSRAKTPPRMPGRYVVRCIRAEALPVLVNYLDSGRWSE